mmetsp:Transcript_5191/g.15269  ORF Transcript_5191/g.15269 Transcript_5191/m.15269 type:complete len:205 (+) Transcript_5191:493-1107(+)
MAGGARSGGKGPLARRPDDGRRPRLPWVGHAARCPRREAGCLRGRGGLPDFRGAVWAPGDARPRRARRGLPGRGVRPLAPEVALCGAPADEPGSAPWDGAPPGAGADRPSLHGRAYGGTQGLQPAPPDLPGVVLGSREPPPGARTASGRTAGTGVSHGATPGLLRPARLQTRQDARPGRPSAEVPQEHTCACAAPRAGFGWSPY